MCLLSDSLPGSRPAPEFLDQVDAVRGILTEDGRTRFLNLRDPLLITATLPPPAIAPGSLRFESALFTFTLVGTAGQKVLVQAATTLNDWQTIATVTLDTAMQDFSDPDSASFTRRFYRIAAAPPP